MKIKDDDYNNTLKENLSEMRTFLNHIEGRVGEQAFAHIYACVEEAIKQANDPEYFDRKASPNSIVRVMPRKQTP